MLCAHKVGQRNGGSTYLGWYVYILNVLFTSKDIYKEMYVVQRFNRLIHTSIII